MNKRFFYTRDAKRKHPLRILKKSQGVTLIELLIALAVGSIVIAAIYSVYITQVRGQLTQQAALEMQQGLRAALTIMEQEIRTAGADPMGAAGAGIIIANNEEFHFTHDIRGIAEGDPPNGNINDPQENIRYAINMNGNLGRETGGGGGLQSILDNVDALNFVYLDRAGNTIATPVDANDLNNIRQVQITIVVRYGQSQRGLLTRVTDTNVYRNQQGEIILDAPNDTFRRLMMTTTVTCRNMALGI